MTTYKTNTEDRKALTNRIGELLGEKLKYTMPGFTYKGRGFTVLKDGDLEADETADKSVIATLIEKGLILPNAEAQETAEAEETAADSEESTEASTEATEAPQGEEAEADGLTVSLPLGRHNGATLRNLVNLLYTRAGLLNKSLGTAFRVDEKLTETLMARGDLFKTEDLLKAIGDFETENGKAIDGLTFEPDGSPSAAWLKRTTSRKSTPSPQSAP